MERKKLYTINVYNRDRTVLRIVADGKVEAIEKYGKWVREQNDDDYVNLQMNFDVEEPLMVYV